MFRNIWDRIKEAGAYLLNSRLVMLILVFCLSSSILIGRLFYLQIVKGEDYLQNYELSIRRTSTIQGTRGNIYDRNGELLAYNKLAYSVTINLSTVENAITTTRRAEKNQEINRILDKVLSIVEEHGDSVISSFGIVLDSAGGDTETAFYCGCIWRSEDRSADKEAEKSDGSGCDPLSLFR